MAIRSRHRNYSIPEELYRWIEPVVQNRLLGFTSHASVITEATRTYILRLMDLGVHPWGKHKETPKELQPTKTLPALAILLTLAAVFILWSNSKNITGLAFLDYQFLNIPDFYNQYYYIIDFVLYALLFSSIAYVTIGKKYGHSGLAVSLGMILAFSLTVAEPVLGFSLKSLGPLALILLFLIVGYLVYGMLRNTEMSATGASSITLLIVYLAFTVYEPAIITNIRTRLPIIDLIILTLLIVGVWKGIQHLTKERKTINLETLKLLPGIANYYPSSKESREIVKKYLEKITKDAVKDSDQILTELAYTIDVIDRFGNDPDAQKVIARKLEDIQPRQHQTSHQLTELQNFVNKLRKADTEILTTLREKHKTLNPEQREQAKNFIDQELAKIQIEDQINTLKQEHDQYDNTITETINTAKTHLTQQKPIEARKTLLNAITQENKARNTLQKIKDLQTTLTALSTKEIPLEK